MADMAVSFAIDHLLPLVTEEAKLLKGIHKEFSDIKRELEIIQAFLKDADRKAGVEGENAVKVWVKEVREAAFRIEDIADEYMIYVGQQRGASGCAALLRKIAHFIKTPMPRHQIASEIQDIKLFVREIRERSERYNLQNQPSFEQGPNSSGRNQNVNWHDPRMASLYIEDAELVGFQAPKNKLIGWLVEGPEECIVFSVVGMGGQGKTTLANKVFKNQKVVGHFDCHAWITVSQSYSVEGLLRDILSKLCKQKREDPPHNLYEMDRDSLIQAVQSYLVQKRYIVVFDDVWDVQFWDKIKFALVDDKKGSRILITTRNMEVVMSCKNSSFSQVHELQPLTHEQSLDLFYKKAFSSDYNGCCPNALANVSSDIVRKCKGLPLAIVVIGRLLSCKNKNPSEWERFNHNLSLELEKDSRLSSITKVLGFSYDDLPHYLKSCLLYLGMYPEDYEVRSKRLIQQWIAEGFVKHEMGSTLEDVAEQYLMELVHRNLVQVSSFDIEGKVKSCRVHDLTREMILKRSKDLSFCQYISGSDELELSGIIRRQSIATSYDNFRECTESSHVRSLLFLEDDHISEEFLTRILKKYKLLKVLDFEDAVQLYHFPKHLRSLIHLKYLSLKGTRIVEIRNLPKFIGKLQNLETLILTGIWANIMPKEICKLKKLRHLVSNVLFLNDAKDGIGGMVSLQTLKYVYMSDEGDEVELIRQLAKLRQLRNLGLRGNITSKHESALCSLLNEMQNLEKLYICAEESRDDVVDLNSVSSPPKHVRKFSLGMKLNKLPEWIPELHNLVKLRLEMTCLTEDPVKSLQNLPNLLYLYIGVEAYSGECLHFEEEGFQNLKELILRGLYNLNSIIIDKGAMSPLEKLTFEMLHEMKRVPPGIEYLQKLQLLTISKATKELKERIDANGGEDHWIIHHVPRVDILS